jgi:hypothetical protein
LSIAYSLTIWRVRILVAIPLVRLLLALLIFPLLLFALLLTFSLTFSPLLR